MIKLSNSITSTSLVLCLALGILGCQNASEESTSSATAVAAEIQIGVDQETAAEILPVKETVSVQKPTPKSPEKRHFRFDYRFELTDLTPGKTYRVWLPVPQSNGCQKITRLEANLPDGHQLNIDECLGNQTLYFDVVAPESGRYTVHIPYEVKRTEFLSSLGKVHKTKTFPEAPNEGCNDFLQANLKVPIDGKPLDLLRDIQLAEHPHQKVRQIYDLVDDHVIYKKEGTGWGHGDVLWVCDNGYGNCTDFHSLFISLTRAQGIPARFEIGFPIPTDAKSGLVGGYHCWAFYWLQDNGWIPVDISEADKHPELKEYYFGNLTADRVSFTVGRDLDLTPKQDGPPLNFFIYPYVEVDGAVVPKKHIQLKFAYAELDS
jgi:transglutaminase-like putative cysteine protease